MKEFLKKISKVTLGTTNPKTFISRKKRDIEKKFYHEKIDNSKFIHFLESLDIKPRDVVFFQSSWNEFYNYTGKPTELIRLIIDYLGPEGTLAMPSNTNMTQKGEVFNVVRTPTNAGLIAECFRRMPNVQRSIHLNSSVCAIGPVAQELIRDHHLSVTPWDKHSPHYKLYKMNAKNLSIGLGKFFTYVTPIHCVDSIMKDKNAYFASLFEKETTYKWINANKEEGSHTFFLRDGILDLKKFSNYVASVPHINAKLSNLEAFSVELKPLIEFALEIAKEGKIIYKSPTPKKHFFNSLAD